jgi:6-phosphogluconolactonase
MIKTLLMTAFSISSLSAAKIPVYLGSGSVEGVSQVLLDSETGELSGLKVAVKTASPGSLTICKDKEFIFTTGRTKGEKTGFVASFARQPDGSLTLVSKQSSMGSGPCHVSLDTSSRFLFVANYSSGSVASYKVDKTGKISPAVSHHQHEGSSVHPQRQTKPHAHSIYCSPDNQFVYSADLGIDKVMIYKLDSKSGKLTPNGAAKVPAGGGARHMAFSKNGKMLYVLNELTLTVSSFTRDEKSGKLKLESTKPVMKEIAEGMSCSEIQVSADGEFLYIACRDLDHKNRDVISVLSVADLRIIQEHPTGVWIPRHFGISPSGKWMLIAGQRENKVVVHACNPITGKLEKTPYSVDLEKPMWILFP